MGNSPSSSSDPHNLHRNASSASTSGAKFTMVYQETPAIVYRPDTFEEAVDQARHTFQIPRYQPLKLSFKYLTVGFVGLTEHNWSAVVPTIHTIFITTEPLPPSRSAVSTPGIPDSRRLSPAPFTDYQTSHPSSLHSQSTERSNILPVSPMDPRAQTQHTQPYPPAEEVLAPERERESPKLAEDTVHRPANLEIPTRKPLPVAPLRSPLGKKPLPQPPIGRLSTSIESPTSIQSPIPRSISFVPPPVVASNVPTAFVPPPLSPAGDPTKMSFYIYCAGVFSLKNFPEYRVLRLPRTHTIADLKDVLSDEFVMPSYLQELWIDGRLLGEESEDWMLEVAGVVQGSVVVLGRAGGGTTA